MAEEDEHEEMPARRKVAILMIALGQETTAEVMKYLSDIEVEQIAQSISELDIVTTEQEDEILEEFEQPDHSIYLQRASSDCFTDFVSAGFCAGSRRAQRFARRDAV